MLKKLQQVETELITELDIFCKENQINYSLGYGTLLGAVRHHGPIPWDDDVDIIMTRADYDRFVSCWETNPIKGYYLQPIGKEGGSSINHAKLRKDGTILSSKKGYKENQHNGIWIDLFPLDKIPTNRIQRAIMLFWAKVRIVYTRNYVANNKGKAAYILSKCMLALPEHLKKKLKAYAEDYILKYNDLTDKYEYVNFAAPFLLKHFFPSETFDEYVKVEYEGYKFSAVKIYDKILKVKYGDYMKLPPEEQRICKHNPEIVVFEEAEKQ